MQTFQRYIRSSQRLDSGRTWTPSPFADEYLEPRAKEEERISSLDAVRRDARAHPLARLSSKGHSSDPEYFIFLRSIKEWSFVQFILNHGTVTDSCLSSFVRSLRIVSSILPVKRRQNSIKSFSTASRSRKSPIPCYNLVAIIFVVTRG